MYFHIVAQHLRRFQYWHIASRGPSAIAELLVYYFRVIDKPVLTTCCLYVVIIVGRKHGSEREPATSDHWQTPFLFVYNADTVTTYSAVCPYSADCSTATVRSTGWPVPRRISHILRTSRPRLSAAANGTYPVVYCTHLPRLHRAVVRQLDLRMHRVLLGQFVYIYTSTFSGVFVIWEGGHPATTFYVVHSCLSTRRNFWIGVYKFLYAVWYLGHPLTSTEISTEIVPGEPLRRGGG